MPGQAIHPKRCGTDEKGFVNGGLARKKGLRLEWIHRRPSMKTITIEMPDDTALPFADTDEQFARALRLAAAI